MIEAKKFSVSEMVIGSLATLTVDGSCAILDWLIIGVFVSPIIRSGVTLGFWMWFKNKGDKNTKKAGSQIAKYSANLIPSIPTTLTVFLVSAFLHNRRVSKGVK